MYEESSGKMATQIGSSLNAIRQSLEANDVFGVADHLTLLVALSAPRLTPQQRKEFQVPSIDGKLDRHGMKERELFRKCTEILAELLCALSAKGIYIYTDVPLGNASGMALNEEDMVPEE